VPHVLFQLTGNNATWYRGTASITPTYTPAMTLNTASGDLTLTGNVTAYGTISDIRMKENIIKLDGAMDKVSAINGYYFNYKTDENKSRLIGVIAQEVEQVMPELVYEFNQIDSNELTKAVRYEHLTAVLVEAIKELKQEIKDLKQEVDVLKGK
jgi:cob(I)alamin adenosyltransferase